MKRIIIFALTGPESGGVTGGFEVYMEEFAIALEKMNAEVEIFCGRDKGEDNLPTLEKISANITVRRFDSPLNFLPLCIIPMHCYYRKVAKKKNDFIIENQSVIPLLTPIYKESILTIIHHLTGKDFVRKQGVLKGLMGMFAERVILPIMYHKKNILTVSNHTKTEIVKYGLNQKFIKVIPPIVKTKAHDTLFSNDRNNIISYIGRYTGRGGNKRIDDVIEIFPAILKEVPDAKLVIAGSMKKRDELVELVHQLNLEDSVTFKGFISDNEKANILSKSKIFASPSYQEGFGITYIEAHSYGTPVVGYKIDGLDTVPSNSGIMVSKGDKDSLKSAIIELLINKDEWEKKSKGALKNAQKYSPETIQTEIIDFMHGLMK